MAEINQFGSVKPVRSGEGMSCAECEAMLMDALDGTLSAKDKAAFDRHIATCSECSQMFADAKRGAMLLEMLKLAHPEPSSSLLDRIIAQTSGQTRAQSSGQTSGQTSGARNNSLAEPAKSAAANVVGLPVIDPLSTDGHALQIHAVVPATAVHGNVVPFRPRAGGRFSLKAITHTMMQPRLAMTAAMAFFSITLTLNLTGVHLSELKASDLTPSNLKHSFYHANASVVRYYDNLRVVYELESRVNELKRDNAHDDAPVIPAKEDPETKDPDQPKPRKAPKSGSGTSERRSPLDQEFKLATYGRLSLAPDDGMGNTARATRCNKLKETLQEGDLV